MSAPAETPVPPSTPPEPLPAPEPPEGGFWYHLRHLWHTLIAAILRTGKPASARACSQKVFGNFLLHVHSTRVHKNTLRLSATLGLGVAALVSFLIAAVTGILLMIYYTPSVDLAYQSVKDIHY